MSKSNVNPNHYKIAGRDRQGEDILQARNKQQFAMSQARERFKTRQALPSLRGPPGPSRAAPTTGTSPIPRARTNSTRETTFRRQQRFFSRGARSSSRKG